MAVTQQQSQYVATDKDNVPKNPQPGDVEVTDAFGNVFDNFNADWVEYDKDNVAVSPQPAYQNGDYVQYTFENVPVNPPWEQDAAQWSPRGFDNQVRTVEAYVPSPLFPGGIPEWFVETVGIPTIEVVLTMEDSEALIVTEDDVNEIELVNVFSLPQVQEFIRTQE